MYFFKFTVWPSFMYRVLNVSPEIRKNKAFSFLDKYPFLYILETKVFKILCSIKFHVQNKISWNCVLDALSLAPPY